MFNQGYPHELRHFIECVREDKAPLVTGHDGRAVLEILYAAYASARTGRRSTLPFRPVVRKPVDLWNGPTGEPRVVKLLRGGFTEAWAALVSRLFIQRLKARPALRVCLPTGLTPVPIYDRIAAAVAEGEVSFARRRSVPARRIRRSRPG